MDKNMSTPAVTVLMPVYNAEAHLAEAVESILAQTFTDFEFLIIDDGSTDRTPDILKEYALRDSRVRLECNERNLQIAATLNKGLALSAASLIARMDSDDIAFPERLERQITRFAAQPELVALGGGVCFIAEMGKRTGQCLDYPEDHNAIVGALWAHERNLAHPTVMFRTEAVKSIGGYRLLIAYAEDYDLWLRLSEVGQLGNLQEPVLLYRMRSSSVSSTKAKEQAICVALAWLSAYSKKKGLPDPVEGLSNLPTPEECRAYFTCCDSDALAFYDKFFSRQPSLLSALKQRIKNIFKL
jgi:glycosyltransferase involved in cell wall biosynthesis